MKKIYLGITTTLSTLLAISPAASAYAQEAEANNVNIADYYDLSLEDIGQLVTSVSRKEEDSFKAAAAVYVITNEDIRKAGAETIPEALRLAPGVQVAQASSNQWAVSVRGFNGTFSNKLLVLIDGRTVYTSLFSGVYWDTQDLLMDDIKQIEIIRGPGATQWGANAVNGIINIITKSAHETSESYVKVKYGNIDRRHQEARLVQKVSDNTAYRAYIKYFDRDETETSSGAGSDNEWKQARGGFRLDSNISDKTKVMAKADIYNGYEGLNLDVPFLPQNLSINENLQITGGHAQTRITHKHDSSSESQLQLYYDKSERNYSLLDQESNTLDLDYQYSTEYKDIHDLVAGASYRFNWDNFNAKSKAIEFIPSRRYGSKYSLFFQDKITIQPQELYAIIGSKFEYNDFTGFEMQPSIKAVWLPSQDKTLWGSISRAVRTPSRAEDNIRIVALSTGQALVRQRGTETFSSEQLLAYELGYRQKVSNNLLLDIAAFYNDYTDLRTLESAGIVFESGIPFVDVLAENHGYGETYGVEAFADWKVNDKWNLKASYSLLKMKLKIKDGSTDTGLEGDDEESPTNQFNITSEYKIQDNLKLNNIFYFVDDLKIGTTDIPSYYRLDAVLNWDYSPSVSFDLAAKNLLDDQYPQFTGALWQQNAEIGRVFYASARVNF